MQAGFCRFELEGGAELCHGGVEIRLLQIRRSQIALEVGIGGPKSDGLLKFLDGSVGFPALEQSQGEVIVSLRVRGRDFEDLGEGSDGAAGIAASLEQKTIAALQRCEIRSELDRLLKAPQRFVGAGLGLERRAEIIPGHRVLGIKLHRLLQFGLGSGLLALARKRHAVMKMGWLKSR